MWFVKANFHLGTTFSVHFIQRLPYRGYHSRIWLEKHHVKFFPPYHVSDLVNVHLIASFYCASNLDLKAIFEHLYCFYSVAISNIATFG